MVCSQFAMESSGIRQWHTWEIAEKRTEQNRTDEVFFPENDRRNRGIRKCRSSNDGGSIMSALYLNNAMAARTKQPLLMMNPAIIRAPRSHSIGTRGCSTGASSGEHEQPFQMRHSHCIVVVVVYCSIVLGPCLASAGFHRARMKALCLGSAGRGSAWVDDVCAWEFFKQCMDFKQCVEPQLHHNQAHTHLIP